MEKSTQLHFELSVAGDVRPALAHEVYTRFQHGHRMLLNRTAWQGKPPRSCGVTRIKSRSQSLGSPGPMIFDIVVDYRPKGYINYLSTTRYDGWTAMVPQEPVDGVAQRYSPREVFSDGEFNDLDFGTFIREEEMPGIKRVTADEVHDEIMSSGSFSVSIRGKFMAPHRRRPSKKIIITNEPDFERTDGFGTVIINLNAQEEQLEHRIIARLERLMHEFIEGKISLGNSDNGLLTFVDLKDALVDCRPNETGDESWFGMLSWYTPSTFLEDLARRIESTYAVEVAIVEGEGLVLRNVAE